MFGSRDLVKRRFCAKRTRKQFAFDKTVEQEDEILSI